MKIQNLFCFWSQSFTNCSDLQLKKGPTPVLKAGSSGKLRKNKKKFLKFLKFKRAFYILLKYISVLFSILNKTEKN